MDKAVDLPNVDTASFRQPDLDALARPVAAPHPPRFLLLYGSLRERSFSRMVCEESARLLQALGGETRIFNPAGLPLADAAPVDHPKVSELRELAQWAEGMVWCSPERPANPQVTLSQSPRRSGNHIGLATPGRSSVRW